VQIKQREILETRAKVSKHEEDYKKVEQDYTLTKREKEEKLKLLTKQIEGGQELESKQVENRDKFIPEKSGLKIELKELSIDLDNLSRTIRKEDDVSKTIGTGTRSDRTIEITKGISKTALVLALGTVLGPFAGLAMAGGGTLAAVQTIIRRRESRNKADRMKDIQPEKEPNNKDILEAFKKMNDK